MRGVKPVSRFLQAESQPVEFDLQGKDGSASHGADEDRRAVVVLSEFGEGRDLKRTVEKGGGAVHDRDVESSRRFSRQRFQLNDPHADAVFLEEGFPDRGAGALGNTGVKDGEIQAPRPRLAECRRRKQQEGKQKNFTHGNGSERIGSYYDDRRTGMGGGRPRNDTAISCVATGQAQGPPLMGRSTAIREGRTMSLTRSLWVTLALCGVLSCGSTHGPSESIADALPAPMADAAGGAPHFEPKDTQEASPSSLGGVLARIDRVASALAASRARAEGSRAAVDEALGLYWGELRAFVRDVHFDTRRLVNPLAPPITLGNLPFDSEQIGAGLQARIPIDLDGSIASTVRVQKEGEKAARRTIEAVRLQLFAAGAELYRSVQALRADREALDEQGRSLDERIRVAREALAVGRLAKVELLRLQAERERIAGQIATIEGRIDGARARLAAAMRLDVYSADLDRLTDAPPSPESVAVNLAVRPDIQAALHRFDQARARLDQVEASYRPRLGIDSQILFNAGYDVAGEVTWQVATALEITLFDGGRRSARMRAVEAEVKAARHALQELHDRARAQVASARASWRAAKARNEAAVRARAASAENARIQRERFNDGRLSAVDLVDAEADLARASAEVKISLIDWWRAFDALRLAAGLPPLTKAPVPNPLPDPDLDAAKDDRP